VNQYYYTIAALPALRLGDKVPIREDVFIQLAADTVRPDHYRVLCKSRWGSLEPTGFPFADRILSWEKELRLELAKARLATVKFSSPQPLPESDGRDLLLEKVKTALALDSPLAVESYLNNLRWSFVEEVSAVHYFNLEALIAYYLKLQLALRQEKFQKITGQEIFEKIYEEVKENLHQHCMWKNMQ